MSFWNRAPKSDRVLFVASVVLLIMSMTLVGVRDHRLHAATEDEEFYRFVDVAAEVYSEIKTKYVDEVESRQVLEGALTGMFRPLDEHSQYMNPDMLQSLERDTSGEFSGIGIHISKRQGVLTVIAPIPGSPAAEAGIRTWDRIVEIEGQETGKMEVTDAVKLLTGPAGTKVTFKVYRQGEKELLTFSITRATVAVQSVFHKMLEDGIGYVRISRFSENIAAESRRAILEMKGEGMEALIIDLRYNTGGLLREAIDLSDLFVDKGEMVVSTRGRLKNQNREYRATTDPIIKVPLFVLVNEGSASASEIFAGAIQDHRLGVIIGPAGKNTYGKGSVQTIGELTHTMTDDENGNPMESALRLTTARYYTPSGRTIHKVGVTPDIGIPLTTKQETELARHGLLGDVFTGEDYHVDEEAEKPADEETPKDTSPQLQTTPKKEEAPAPADPNKKFYEVEPPKLLEKDDFKDTLLDEAVKQMRIYRILQKKGQGVEPAIASMASGKADEVAAP